VRPHRRALARASRLAPGLVPKAHESPGPTERGFVRSACEGARPLTSVVPETRSLVPACGGVGMRAFFVERVGIPRLPASASDEARALLSRLGSRVP
jgi:hypothetical protein